MFWYECFSWFDFFFSLDFPFYVVGAKNALVGAGGGDAWPCDVLAWWFLSF